MPRFIETIKWHDGQFYNMNYHQQRMDGTIQSFFAISRSMRLIDHLANSKVPKQGLFKCRVIYDDVIRSIEFVPYLIKPVRSLKIVRADSIDYAFKFEDRGQLIKLYNQRDACDDIIIVKDKVVTDASYANLLFKRGNDWVTPSNCLLNGTMRQNLLDLQKIRSEPILVGDIRKFEKVKLINSMLGFEGQEIDASRIAL
jgi:4-amino-4-deoxychorismate lyase